METKVCKVCGIEKNITEYHKGYAKCKECYNEVRRKPIKEKLTDNKDYNKNKSKKYYEKNKDKIYSNKREYMIGYYEANKGKYILYNKKYRQTHYKKKIAKEKELIIRKICKVCYEEKLITEYGKQGYNNTCKKCAVSYYKVYYNNNKDKIKEKTKGYYTQYDKNRRLIDASYKLSKNIRTLINKTFKHIGTKKNEKTEYILGCTIQEFKEYIINKFEDWMTLNNHGIYTGNYNETWQLDHIEPISNATTPEDIIRLNHYTNFQPLCSKKNLEKSNKIIQ